jgi:putative sigma-54 modulation protein
MRIEVVGRNLEVTNAIREHTEAKAAKLTKFFNGVQAITIRLSREDHQHRGKFGVELVIDVQKHQDFIVHEVGEDLYASIDAVLQKGSRQLAEFKEQLRNGKKRTGN